MKKVNIYIDGFNVYHVLRNNIKYGVPPWEMKLKWCDLKSLCLSYLQNDEQLGDIYFFTADSWIQNTKSKWLVYQKALNESGVKIVKWQYNNITKIFICKMKVEKMVLKFPCFQKMLWIFIPRFLKYKTYEEKRTDVNIAVRIVEDAFLWKYQRAIIMSGDSDIVPAIETVKRNFSNITFSTLWIVGTKWQLIKSKCDTHDIIWYNKWKSHLFPEKVNTTKWNILQMPKEWK